LRSFYN